MPVQRTKKYFYVIYSLILVLLSIFCAEIGMRIYHVFKHQRRYVYIPDFYLGYALANNNQVIWRGNDDHPEFRTHQRTNALGLLGPEVQLEKPAGTYRIVVLGDSYTEGFQVSEEEKFCTLLQNQLNRLYGRPDRRFEVLNAGVRGYSPITHYLKYKLVMSRFQPDFVVLQLFANDVSEDNHVRAKSLMDENGLPLKLNRYFSQALQGEYQEKSRDLLTPKWILEFHKKLMDASRLYEYAHVRAMKAAKRSPYNEKMRSVPEFDDAYQFYIVQGHNEEVTFGEKGFRRKRWGFTRKCITELTRLVERDQRGFLMFNIPVEAQLELKEYGYHTQLFFFGGVEDYFHDRLQELSEEEAIDFIDMEGTFQRHAEEGLYFHWDGHLTQAGHRAVAERLVAYFGEYFKQ